MTFDIALHEVCVRVGLRYVMTKFSRMDSLPNFLTHGAPLCARFARESSSKTNHLLPQEEAWHWLTRQIIQKISDLFGKNGKKVIPRKLFLFFRNISKGMNRSI